MHGRFPYKTVKWPFDIFMVNYPILYCVAKNVSHKKRSVKNFKNTKERLFLGMKVKMTRFWMMFLDFGVLSSHFVMSV